MPLQEVEIIAFLVKRGFVVQKDEDHPEQDALGWYSKNAKARSRRVKHPSDTKRGSLYVAADFVDHGSPFPIPPGPDGYREILTFVTQVLKIRYTLEDVIETDDRIVLRATARGEGVPQVHGPAANGRGCG